MLPASIHPSAFIHEKSIVEPGVQIGARTRVWAFAHVLPGAVIGADCNICDHVFIENDVVIGNHVTVKCGIYIWDGARVEDHVFLGPNVAFTNDDHPRSKRHLSAYPRINVQRGASLGANATILPGLTIGQWAMVGAGCVINKDVPDFALVVGNPARKLGYVCICTKRLKIPSTSGQVVCECRRTYQWNNATLKVIAGDEPDW
jgi:acetyltransferase-like isoleucine patch superfamily enzyme